MLALSHSSTSLIGSALLRSRNLETAAGAADNGYLRDLKKVHRKLRIR